MVGEEPLGNLEREAAPSKVREGVGRVCTVWIHEPISGCWSRWDRMVVDDPHGNSRSVRLFHSLNVAGPTVDSKQKFDAVFLGSRQSPNRDPMPICRALGDVALCNCASLSQGANHDRSARQTICIEVANDENRLTCLARLLESRDKVSCIREEHRVMERPITHVEEASNRLGMRNVAAREKREQHRLKARRERSVSEECSVHRIRRIGEVWPIKQAPITERAVGG
jgi:hypothetical protein